ncbi:MAG: hypothetical protein A3K19_20395 [Lentisphaerae bacterium RIFOXYB12_FULL_65_16]|nr:MAG: hypothetical protein A3K18_32725 [Lentisphaerae bacterium RIFOXYA12_64_32]OGV89322.1 MAG: hypothetical protein A3K19_20395 [Lentisphaerae bacterium RIFOXYB12_FULL_65_16]
MDSGSTAAPTRVMAILIGTVLFTYLVRGLTWRFNADEFQCMVLGANMAQGKQLYAEIWDNHGPFLNYAAAGICALLSGWESHGVMFCGRLLMFVFVAVTVLGFYRLSRNVVAESPWFPGLACLVLLLSPLFARPAIEFRADNPMTCFWVASLAFWFRAYRTGKLSGFLCSGLLLGAAFWCSLKTLLLGVAVGSLFLAAMVLQRRLLSMSLAVVVFGAGVVVAPVLMLLALAAQGNLDDFWLSFVKQNTDRGHSAAGDAFLGLLNWSPFFASLMLLSLVYAGWRAAQRRIPDTVLLALVCSLVLLAQYCFALPTHYRQSVLPLIIPASLVEAWVLLELFPICARRFAGIQRCCRAPPRKGVLVVSALLVTAVLQEWCLLTSPAKIRWADGLLREIEPGACVLDGFGFPFFRPHPGPYLSWVDTLRDRYRRNALGFDLPALLDAQDVRYVILDRRVRELGPAVERFILENYRPLLYPDLWAAGQAIAPAGGAETSVRIAVAGSYHWFSPSGSTQLLVDGQPAPNPVTLADGPHRLSWDGQGVLHLCTAPPDRWLGDWAERNSGGAAVESNSGTTRQVEQE